MSSHGSLYGNMRKEYSFQTWKLEKSAMVEMYYLYSNIWKCFISDKL